MCAATCIFHAVPPCVPCSKFIHGYKTFLHYHFLKEEQAVFQDLMYEASQPDFLEGIALASCAVLVLYTATDCLSPRFAVKLSHTLIPSAWLEPNAPPVDAGAGHFPQEHAVLTHSAGRSPLAHGVSCLQQTNTAECPCHLCEGALQTRPTHQ